MASQEFYETVASQCRLNQDRYYRLAYRYAGDEQDALDIVQTAVVKALTARPMREPKYISTWVYRIVVNTAIDWLRSRKRLVPVDDDYFDAVPNGDGGGESEPGDSDGLRRALDTLPTDYKTVVMLRFLEELKLQEVADILRLNVNTVKTRLHRALQLLRVQMEDEGNG